MSVLEFKNVSYQREGMNSPLKDVNFTIKQGDLVHLRGNNGAGKSTIIDFILGIREPDSGEINIFGESPTDLKHKLKTGAVIQKLKFPSNVTQLGKWINLIESHYPKAREKVNSALQKLDNQNSNNQENSEVNQAKNPKYFKNKFSGGEESKIFFALAQAGDPDLLILDEPTSNLSPENSKKIWQQIQEFTDEGKTVLFVCHDSEIGVNPNKTLIVENGQVTVVEEKGISLAQREPKKPEKEDKKPSLFHWIGLFFQHISFNLYQTIELDKKFLTLFLFSTILYAVVVSYIPRIFPLEATGVSHSFIIANAYSLYLALVAITITGNTIAIERQDETLNKILKILPLPPVIYLSAKVIASLLIVTIATFAMVGITILISDIPSSEIFIFSFSFMLGVIPFLFLGVALGYLFGQKEIQLIALLSCFLLMIPLYLANILEPFKNVLEQSSKWIKWFNIGELVGNYFATLSPFYHNIQLLLYFENETKYYDLYTNIHKIWIIWYIIFALILALSAYQNVIKKDAKA
ncbi:ATP-binding cassette domain-containing protein [Cyanobacterium aponinum UTEX 3221]|uniref:ATP-binding cassette domain-containing protein n=1 Tax=Cyanobacterium aponinum TaxID=379064 RepID=UPI002B4BFB20|nr:ATP-binding cassette domain-containing protein [Cyanobacterium aponinum]WRL38787.1 ATP-binding cassette domain-containing protein [Cyanobacterium aponinum UTEX 3221]